MSSGFVRMALLWGAFLWLVGYVLGILFFSLLPSAYIGWVIMPIGILITLWVLVTKIRLSSLQQYLFLGIVWVAIAILGDYFFIVKLFHPENGYYDLDVYLYYLLTLLLPLLVGVWKTKSMVKR